MEDNKPPTQKKYTAEYHKVTSKLFYNSLINIPLFAVPAFTALFIGKHFDAKYGTDKSITLILLFIALTCSWVIVLRKNARLTREYKEIRQKMKQESEDTKEVK